MSSPEPVPMPFGARAYGCFWESAFPLPLFQPADAGSAVSGEPAVRVLPARADAEDRPFSSANGRQRFCTDGLRYVADDGTLIDVYKEAGAGGPARIEITPGSEWNGTPSAAFYGTGTAALLAMKGDLPMHGSAVELGGRAVVLCGHSGAGKSTLTAALIGAGARLLADDLSGIHIGAEDLPVLFAGRRAIRLFPDVAEFLGERSAIERMQLPGERKVLALPPSAVPEMAFPLAGVVILGATGSMLSPEAGGLTLLEYSFRRRAFRHLPGFKRRVELARLVAARVPLIEMPGVQARSSEGFRGVAEMMLQELARFGIGG